MYVRFETIGCAFDLTFIKPRLCRNRQSEFYEVLTTNDAYKWPVLLTRSYLDDHGEKYSIALSLWLIYGAPASGWERTKAAPSPPRLHLSWSFIESRESSDWQLIGFLGRDHNFSPERSEIYRLTVNRERFVWKFLLPRLERAAERIF